MFPQNLIIKNYEKEKEKKVVLLFGINLVFSEMEILRCEEGRNVTHTKFKKKPQYENKFSFFLI